MRTNVSVVGPIAPFRGGIARHSTALARAFAARADVELKAESFARLYPRFLYPGESDRDLTGSAAPCPARYEIDTLNPLTWRRAAKRVAQRPSPVAVIPAWTFFVAPTLGWISRRLRRDGIPVVMIVHNAADHERSGWKSQLLNWQLSAADGFVTHSENLAQALRDAGHRQPVVVTGHPAYSDFPPAQGTLPRENALELLCFGLVRRYKGVDIALRALVAANLPDVRLTIAGEVWEDGAALRTLIESPPLRGKVELIDRYVSDAEAAELFARSDAVLAPYRAVTGSGVLALARHYRRPVIAPDLSGFRETIDHNHTGWLFPAGDERALATLLRDHVKRQTTAAMAMKLEQGAGSDEWQDYAQSVLNLAERLGRAGVRA